MTIGSWFALTGVWLAALALPGPDIFLIMRLGVRERKSAVLAALGIMTGNMLWVTVSVLGITALMNSYPILLPAIQIFGVFVLGFLGIASVRSGFLQLRGQVTTVTAKSGSNSWFLGLITNLANPKALIFFTALLGQFIPPGSSWSISVAIIVFMFVIGLIWFVGLALISSGSAFRLWFRDAAAWFDVVAGLVFVIVAAIIAFEVVLFFLNNF